MTTSRLRRVGSVAALAVSASSGVALVSAAGPAAADTPSPVASSGYALSISVADKSINPGSSDTVSGVLTHSSAVAAGDTVYLRARLAGKRVSHRVASGTTGDDGSVSFTVTPAANTHYRLVFRLPSATTPAPVPAGVTPSTVVGARSKVATVHVLRDSSLSIRARELKNGHELLAGQLRGGGHSLARRKVELQELAVGTTTWTTVKTHKTDRKGVVSYGVAAPATAEEFQLVFAGGPNFGGSQSSVVTVNVG
jgi:hypothetical protein